MKANNHSGWLKTTPASKRIGLKPHQLLELMTATSGAVRPEFNTVAKKIGKRYWFNVKWLDSYWDDPTPEQLTTAVLSQNTVEPVDRNEKVVRRSPVQYEFLSA
jgi:hypothetical protein